ncbi:hypothetical protein BG005_011684 [Podila minutissima]|nr:hypothetical protein BG005_011684 [Podila minutissima]
MDGRNVGNFQDFVVSGQILITQGIPSSGTRNEPNPFDVLITIGHPATNPIAGSIQYTTNRYLYKFINGNSAESLIDYAFVTNAGNSIGVTVDTSIAAANQLSNFNARSGLTANAYIITSGGFSVMLSGTALSGDTCLFIIFTFVASSITTSLHAIVIKRALDSVHGVSVDLVYCNNFLSVVAMLPILVASGEVTSVVSLYYDEENGQRRFVLGIVVTGIFGFLANVARKSHTRQPQPHMVYVAVPGHFAFQEIITAGRLEGIVLILGGSTIYKAKATIPLTLRDIDDDEDPYTAAVDSKDVLPKA